mgnify:CR=1 FL=1
MLTSAGKRPRFLAYVTTVQGEYVHPADARDWNASPRAAAEAGRRGQADRFILKFIKP